MEVFTMLIRIAMVLLFAMATVLSANEPAVSIKRLTDEFVEQKKVAFTCEQEKNNILRKVVGAGSACLGAVALLGGGYAYCKRRAMRASITCDQVVAKQNIAGYSPEKLKEIITYLLNKVKEPDFLSIAWLKSTAWSLILSPSGIMSVVEMLGTVGKVFCTKIFYKPTVSWYMNGHTKHIGKIVERSDKHSLIPSLLVKELEHNAQMLDESAKSIMPVDHEYYRRCIMASFSQIVEDVAGIVAFMQYRSCCLTKLSVQARERAEHLFNYTNQMSDVLEHALELSQEQSKKQLIVPFIKGFFTELEQVLVSFMRIEQECL